MTPTPKKVMPELPTLHPSTHKFLKFFPHIIAFIFPSSLVTRTSMSILLLIHMFPPHLLTSIMLSLSHADFHWVKIWGNTQEWASIINTPIFQIISDNKALFHSCTSKNLQNYSFTFCWWAEIAQNVFVATNDLHAPPGHTRSHYI